MSRRVRDDRGATVVEFALVLPIFLAIMGIAAYLGWLVYVQAQLSHAAERAARYAAIPTTGGTYSFCLPSILPVVNANLNSERATTAELTVTDSTGKAATSDCTVVPTGYVRVVVSHTFTNWFSEWLASMTPASGSWTLSEGGQVAVETP